MNKVYEDIREMIGNTPILKLNHMGVKPVVNIYAKLELMNPAGSVKDRIGVYMIDDAKKLKPDLSVTLFNMPPTPEEFTRASAKLRGLDYAGFDGPCSAQSFFHEPASHSKRFIRDSWERTKAETAGVTGSFALVENILIPDSAFEEFKQEYRRVLDEVRPDHLSIYYYGHNNESAETVQKFCMDELKKHIAEGGLR